MKASTVTLCLTIQLNSLKADWIRSLYRAAKCDLVSIQEHFKKNKTIDKFFKDNFPEHSSYVIPAFREKDQDSGRPKGGHAQLPDRTLDIKVDRISTKNLNSGPSSTLSSVENSLV